jgi:septum formation inhibitor MinC
MRIVILAGLVGLALAGCQGNRDPFCLAHNAADLTPAAGVYAAMKPSERRAAEDRLNATAQRCGWEP